ncbi:MAG TPA: Flp family type IVb pilin [Anaerolineales bacterium]|jgi:pilus assembly protein Flp/PilA|nr:Flp family type IVb pilin [Anaerolineales bacterium]
MKSLITFLQLDERGQGLLEYALIIVLVAVVVILAMSAISPEVGNAFSEVGSAME